MEAFLTPKNSEPLNTAKSVGTTSTRYNVSNDECDSTELKLATLSSLFPSVEQAVLLDLLISTGGSVENVKSSLSYITGAPSPRKRLAAGIGSQSSLSSFKSSGNRQDAASTKRRALTRKGQTLHLYSPEDIAAHTPCSIIHNFLPSEEADSLLKELLEEAPTFERQTFKLFDNVVQSPHSACFYVDSLEERESQKTEYLYNGSFLSDVRQITPQMRTVSSSVQGAVNREIAHRIKHHYADGRKLKYQSPDPWIPNAAFVNCYKGGAESVYVYLKSNTLDQHYSITPRSVFPNIYTKISS